MIGTVKKEICCIYSKDTEQNVTLVRFFLFQGTQRNTSNLIGLDFFLTLYMFCHKYSKINFSMDIYISNAFIRLVSRT